jgi:tRNA (guanosine-2'-O-)-methyltransferase
MVAHFFYFCMNAISRMMHPVTDLDPEFIKELIAYLRRFITTERFLKFQEIIRFRTRHLTIVLEDIYQPHNASAVLRTCDCFGIQDVHIIENHNKYQVNPDVALGSSKWLDLIRYNQKDNNTSECIANLKKQGYRIIATTPHKDGFTPETLPLNQKTALLFGTEMEGLTQVALEMADDFIRIPMVGFTESLNISVSAAIFIQTLTSRLRESEITWQATDSEKEQIMVNWLSHSIKKSDMIIHEFLGKHLQA